MDLQDVLEDVASGERTVEEARRELDGYTRVDDFARLDTGRGDRAGIPEVVLGDGKSIDQLRSIADSFLDEQGHVVFTRVDEAAVDTLEALATNVGWYPDSRVLVLRTAAYEPPEPEGTVAVVSGGTSDVPVAEEAAVTAGEMGCTVETFYDVGVAGIHRILSEAEALSNADAVVVAAGREGALPTVVAGLVDSPVIGLPVSIGYGHGGDGEAALAGMLQSCTVLSTVNIDAGFVAGAQAAQIART
ncbi:NCAIR mutase (PurE)-related protein [Halalkaliarchaeum sp. AArc-CO]|uniref:nickel pincer cofactor biosynthesis protein LarB n=1 Tax=Halalkaliarchaeum sp. AArc-CO TaxID=2866381 RepID=UPI00217ECA81|nr:nickel pincer cofactor biosynthesis protein LarB [Halalkaliarchaeum sp. AArc-CO]UWG51124.1 NCAIR mutase (PurE)-related protein [Halalkaliarchaeum sp. AArc-CO]